MRQVCLGCKERPPRPFLDLGALPLANALVAPENMDVPDQLFPLSILYCPTCHLVQLSEQVEPDRLFNEYLYFSSYSETALSHFSKMAETLCERFKLDAQSRVLEIGSNDGYLLNYFLKRHIPVLGIEPAANIARIAHERGIPTLNRFFGEESYPEIADSFGQANVIIGNNVLAHVPKINSFLRAVKCCLKPTGVGVFEFPYVKSMLENLQFDTIYHEHVFYYSLSAVVKLADRAGLQIFDVTNERIHGGSLRIFLQNPGVRPIRQRVGALLAEEMRAGLTSPHCYTSFGRQVLTLKDNLVSLLRRIKTSGKRLAGYGAPAKGSVLLNYCGIGREFVEFVVDQNIHKQGRYLPGVRIPVYGPEKIFEARPDVVLILPWNLKQEIIHRLASIRSWRAQFLIPIPRPVVVP